MSKIEDTLKKIAANTSKAPSRTSSNTDGGDPAKSGMMGDPNCEICGGVGFVREDLPTDHPNFGRMAVCSCRQSEVSQGVRQKLYRMSNLEALKHLTFDAFQPHGRVGLGPQQVGSLERAFNTSRQFATSLEGWLLLLGDYGCGKTHLAAAIANFVVSLGIDTLFITVPDLLDWLRFAYDSGETTFEERFDEIRNVRLLVLDDFGTQNATPWAQEKLFQIVNYRYVNRLPLVVTSNLEINYFEGRIRSRLQDPELVDIVRIEAPDYRNPQDDTGHSELSSLALHHNRTFGNFNLRKGEGLTAPELQSLEKAFKAAQQYAENPTGWILFTGTFGCGKTHLAAAIGNYRAALGFPPLLVVVPDLLDHLRATFNPNSTTSYDRRFDEVKTAPLLILDDLGTQSATPWAREKLYQLFNHRYNAELPTVITTASRIEELDPRVYSRMLDKRLCKIFGITAPPYHGGNAETDKKSSAPRGPRTRKA